MEKCDKRGLRGIFDTFVLTCKTWLKTQHIPKAGTHRSAWGFVALATVSIFSRVCLEDESTVRKCVKPNSGEKLLFVSYLRG